ncbi:hypothetical protein [Paraburkholderia gardini]|uniref:hypothetical protein n=1 Tax=Paraburkholderia gardini TaxID=2823469 RepID=UPI001E59CF1A|nr:hypothetical protein [Paraburkholderia gardini]
MPNRKEDSPPTASLLRRRVSYPPEPQRQGEGVVCEHDVVAGMVVLMDVEDGSFWRGSDEHVEVIV